MAYWFIAPYIRDIPHLNDGQAMSKLIPATERGTMGRTFLTGDAAFKAPGLSFIVQPMVTVWDIETGKQKKVFNCHSHVLVLAVSPFLDLIAAGEARDGQVFCGRPLKSFNKTGHGPTAPRTLLHRFEGGALRSLQFHSAGEVHCLVAAAAWK
eukprot:Skav218481  [mRNA]  locus=scaffold538:1181748:1183057:+ [translate_table: standard]